MNQTDRIAQLEEEVRALKAQLEFEREERKKEIFVEDLEKRICRQAEQELLIERDRLQAIGDHFPNGSLFRFEINPQNMSEMKLSYLSATWEEVMGVGIEETKADASRWFDTILPEFTEQLTEEIVRCTSSLEHFMFDYQIQLKDNRLRWIQASSHPKKIADDKIVFDGFVLDITQRKENEIELEKLSGRQAILIKVLHIVQSAGSLSQAMNESLAEIGKYAQVSRVNVFEKSDDGTTVSNTFGWCNDGIEPIIENLQNIPIEVTQTWFDMFDANLYICASDTEKVNPDLSKILLKCGVKSVVVLPLSSGSFNYGFVVFDECTANREWDKNEVELLRNLSKILSSVKRRFQAEDSLRQSHQTMRMVLNNINANILVTDFETMKILFVNDALRKMVDEEMESKNCWKVLQVDQNDVCDFCPKNHLLDNENCSTGMYRFEHYFDKFKKHMMVDAIATEWIDGRRVLMEVIFDITDRKNAEIELAKHRDELEILVKERTEELEASYEELQASNEELFATHEELQATNDELNQYQTKLESMVVQKTSELTARKKELENLSLSQSILIEVLKIVQSADDLSQAMKQALAEIGKYAGVSRIHAFEKNADGTAVNCFMGWCNDGIEYIVDNLQNIPVEMTQSFFDMSETGEYVSATDSDMLAPALSELLIASGVKSVLVFPLSLGSVNYGFIVFDECVHKKKWDTSELELLKNLSQIISTARNRYKAERELAESESKQRFVFDNTKDVFWIADYETTKFTFVSGNCLDTFGAVGEAFIGMSFYECFLPEKRGEIEALVKQKVEEFYETGAQHFQVTEQHYNKDGVKIWMESSFQLAPDENGKITQVVGIERDIDERKKAEEALVMERDRLQAIGDNFPDGSLFRYEVNPLNMEVCFSYLSATWEQVMGISIEETMADSSKAFDIIFPEFLPQFMEKIKKGIETSEHLLIETKNHYKGDNIKWIQISSHPKKIADDRVIFDGFVLDITRRKDNEMKLAKHQEELEFLVKERTEDLLATNEELHATTEELQATNEEMQATNEVLHDANNELDKYKTQLEEMVSEKTSELIVQQRELRKLNRRQEVFIKVMQILQLEEDVSKGMNMVLDVIGHYTHSDRVQIWENNDDGITYGSSYEWCNKGIEPVVHFCQNLPLEYGKPWFDVLKADGMICTSDIYSLAQPIYEMLEKQHVRAIVVIPLSIYGVHFGFISYTVCDNKNWDEKEVELLINISQVFSNVMRRRQVEKAMNLSQQAMRTVLDNINTKIIVTEFDSLKILFANNQFKQEAGEDVEGNLCWKSLNAGLNSPCEQCPRSILLDGNGAPTGVHFWEDYNPLTERWCIIMTTAIKWVNGQLAIMEVSTDITDRKRGEIDLVHARERAEESDKLKSAFLANMSHEIRTPINGIVGFLHFVASDDLTPERKENYLSIIKNSAAQLVQLIDDIIDVSKIEAKQMKIFPVPVNVNQLLTEAQMLYENNLQNRNKLHVMLLLDDSKFIDKCIAIVDPVRLRQVLNNLMVNAIKYTEKGYIRFGYRQSAPDKLEFVVEDTGVGMAANQHELIFERFRQAENHFHEGTGLGLNIAKSLVQMMGGEIWVESTEGAGSAFYFTISYEPVF